MNKSYAEQIGIRRLELADIDEVLRIADALSLSHWSREDLADEIEREDSRCFVSSFENNICGFIVARMVPGAVSGQKDAEIYNFGVKAGNQGLGIGRRLLNHALLDLAAAGVSSVWLEVRASNTRALGLYNSAGFIEAARRPNLYTEPVEEGVVMSLELALSRGCDTMNKTCIRE